MSDVIKTNEVTIRGYLDIEGNDTKIEFLSDGKSISLSELLKSLNGELVIMNIKHIEEI